MRMNGIHRNGRRRRAGMVAFATIVLAAAAGVTSAAAGGWSVTRITQVTGTTDMFLPGAGVANLDAGDLVAGNTRWDNDGDGIVFNDTHVGFLWSPAAGSRVFAINDTLYFNANFQFPASIADNQSVVGTDIFRNTLSNLPFLWTPADGFNFLPLPCPGPPPDNPGGAGSTDCNGVANAIAATGQIAVGFSRQGVFGSFPTTALRWTITKSGRRLRLADEPLATPDAWSNARAVSADGSVIVGDSGPSDTQLQAARWVDGVRQPLEAVGVSSSARFTASDGSAAIGLADTGTAGVLVHWDAAGAALVAQPPAGASVATIAAINPSATAAVGALSFGGNQAPYLWTLAGGFTVIPENGREQDYDLSEALDVSDDGTVVVGALQAGVVFNGDPPPRGFLWTAGGGLVLLDDLLADFGFANAGIYQVSAISGDGRRVLAAGTFPRTSHDTTSLVVELSGP